MNSRAIFLLLSIFWAIIITSSTTEINSGKCPYHETIDLTNQTRNFDGSYEYQGIFIKNEDQALYNYKMEMRNKKVTSPLHLRGCVCNKWKSCIKLCCEIDAFYNETSFKCEKIQEDFNLTWDVPVVLNNGSGMLVNIFEQFIYQVGVPCKKATPLILDMDVWILLENGTLNMTMDNVLLSTVNYCFTPYKLNGSSEYLLTPFSCPTQFNITWTLFLNTYGMAVSVLFLIPTIVVYLMIKQLRGNLRGKLLLCYLVSLVIAYGIISYINISNTMHERLPCSLLGYTCYFFFMAAYLWLSVLCYDIWKNFREVNFELNSCENIQRFVYYSLYTWIGAGIFTSLTIWADLSPSVPDNLKPGIGDHICFLDTTKWSASIYFYGPNLIILLFNFATFAYLTVHIYKVRKDSAKITHKEYFFRENAVVILRLFLVMGVSWIFDILSYSLPDDENTQYAFVLSDLLNATQGILIFVFFVLKRNVLELLKKRFNSIKAARLRCSTTSSPTASTNLQTFN